MRRAGALVATPILALGLTACGLADREHEGVALTAPEVADAHDGEDTEESESEPEPATAIETETGTDTEAEVEPDEQSQQGDIDALFGTRADVGGPYGQPRDGVWAVGPAGQVEFRITGSHTLELVDIRPTDGWAISDQEVSSDEIDVDLRRGPVTYEIQIEIEAGVLEIEIDQDIDPAQGGTFHVGEAATVTITVDGGTLVLGEVVVNEGWSEIDRDIDMDEIELDFRRLVGGVMELWEINAELDDGQLEIEIDYELEGTFSG